MSGNADAAFGSSPTKRELEIFHAWVRAGRTEEAALRLGCSPSNVSLGLRRLKQRLGIEHQGQLILPLIVTPALGRARRLERDNRRLRHLLREVLASDEVSSRRIKDGGVPARAQRRKRRSQRRRALDLGILLPTIDRVA